MPENKEQIIIKTICDFLFLDQYEETASFLRFEQCFQPLFNNINISFETIFKDICGEKKKYITYKRFAKSYINYKKGINISEDTKLFFDLLINSIFKYEKKFVGEVKKNFLAFSTLKTSSKRNVISKIQVLSDKNNNQIQGINIEYDEVSQNKMHPKSIENNLDITLEMNLNIMDEEKTIIQNKKKFKVIKKGDYLDAITHIFGTLNPETGFISFLGFKCISGKTVYVGLPKGEGFLFGKFGYKFHDLKLQMTEGGITRMEPGFNESFRKNIHLDKISGNLSDINLYDDEVIKDEEYFDKLNDLNDLDKFLTTTIISDDHFFKEKPKDEYCGYDYKEVVDQVPRKWIFNIIQQTKDKNKNKEEKNMTLDVALKNYDEECKKTKDKKEQLESLENQQDNKEINDGRRLQDEYTGVILHKKKAYKAPKNNGNYNKSMVITRKNKLKLSMIKSKNNENTSVVMLNKNNRNKLGMMINEEICETNSNEKFVQRKSRDNIPELESENLNSSNNFISQKQTVLEKVEEEEDDKEGEDEKNIELIPDLHPENNMTLKDLQKNIDDLKELLKKSDLKEEDRVKLENYKIYIFNKKIF
jgi:hypothetical protein